MTWDLITSPHDEHCAFKWPWRSSRASVLPLALQACIRTRRLPLRVRLWEPEIETKRTPETNRTPVVGARMPPWSKKPPLEPEVSPWDWDAEVLGGVNLWQFAALAGLLGVFCCLLCYWQRRANVWAIGDRKDKTIDCELHTGAMHKCVYFKEVFWNYLCAAMLEPLLSIVDRDATSKSLAANVLQLFGLLWWIYNLHDAFDSSDTTQVEKFIGLGKDPTKAPKCLKLPQDDQQKNKRKERARKDIAGKVVRDLALYYMLFNIACAELGIFARRQVVHSYCVVILWVILHHAATRATVWLEGGFTAKNYLLTLCSPSVTLQPFEYCLPFDGVESLDSWNDFVKDTCGVSLTVYTACLPGAAVPKS